MFDVFFLEDKRYKMSRESRQNPWGKTTKKFAVKGKSKTPVHNQDKCLFLDLTSAHKSSGQ